MLSVRSIRAAAIQAGPLDVAAGECVVLTGPSGSGKSRLLRAIADLDPNDGEMSLDGTPREAIAAPDWRRRVALVPAESGWWEDRVAPHMPPGDPGPMLDALGLPPEALEWEVARLSSGERHRLAIIRALLGHPQILMLDEPSAALDPDATTRLESLLQARRAEGLGLLLVTHDADQANRLATVQRRVEAGHLLPEDEP